MAVPNHTISPVTEDDHQALITLLQNKKFQLTINRVIIQDWPNPALQREIYTIPIAGPKDPSQTSLKVVDDETGQIVGHVVYTRQKVADHPTGGDDPEERRAALVRDRPEGTVPEVYEAMIHAVTELEPEFESGEEYISLTHWAVDPQSKGKGVGEWLVKTAHDAAKAAGLPLTVCAEPDDHAFLASCGFRDVKTADIDLARFAPPLTGFGVFRLSRMVMVE